MELRKEIWEDKAAFEEWYGNLVQWNLPKIYEDNVKEVS